MRSLSVMRVLLGLLVLMLQSPDGTMAQSATPAPSGASGFADLMHHMPSHPLEGSFWYADYAQQLATFGYSGRPADGDIEAWREAVYSMPTSMAGDISGPEWTDAFGFDLWDVDQMMESSTGDTNYSIFRGRFDTAALVDAWTQSDYVPVESGGLTYYSAGDDLTIDFEHPAHKLHFGMFSYLLLVGDDTVIATPTLAGMETIIDVQTGEQESMAEAEGAGLAAAPADLVAATVADGAWLQPQFDDLALVPNNPNVPEEARERLATQVAEAEIEAPRMPPIRSVLVGVTAGDLQVSEPGSVNASVPVSRSVVVAVLADPADVELAAEVAADRFMSQDIYAAEEFAGQPYRDLYTDPVFDTAPDHSAIVIDLTPVPGVPANLLINLMQAGNLTLLYWI